jgi:hypothetical protein
MDLFPVLSQAFHPLHAHRENRTDRKHSHHFSAAFDIGGDRQPSFEGLDTRRCRPYLKGSGVDGAPLRTLVPQCLSSSIVEDSRRAHVSMWEGSMVNPALLDAIPAWSGLIRSQAAGVAKIMVALLRATLQREESMQMVSLGYFTVQQKAHAPDGMSPPAKPFLPRFGKS